LPTRKTSKYTCTLIALEKNFTRNADFATKHFRMPLVCAGLMTLCSLPLARNHNRPAASESIGIDERTREKNLSGAEFATSNAQMLLPDWRMSNLTLKKGCSRAIYVREPSSMPKRTDICAPTLSGSYTSAVLAASNTLPPVHFTVI
jgi:hypothetical protein